MKVINMKSLCLVFGLVLIMSVDGHLLTNRQRARNMVRNAERYYKANGLAKTVAAVNVKNGRFHSGSFYVYIMDMGAVIKAHPTNPGLRGRNLYNLKDNIGHYFMHTIVRKAKKSGRGWVTYNWTNPATKRIGTKHVYFIRIGNLIVACGAYDR